jgi:hypothetical protein
MRAPKSNACFSISSAPTHAKNLLVVLPSNFEDFDAARHILEPLLERMKPLCATIFVRENFRSWLPNDLRARIMTYDPAQHNWLGLPKEKVTRRIGDLEANVVVDLTPGFCAFTAGLAAASGAPLRISLNHEHAAKFYNLLITPEAGRTLQERYELLLSYV